MLYLMLITGYSALMCLVYVLFLRNRAMHAFNRVYLLAAAVLPVVVPLLKFPEAVGEQIRTATALGVRLPEVVISPSQHSTAFEIVSTLYLCVSMVLLGAFVYKLVSLKKLVAKSERIKDGSHTLVVNSGYGPGSWFNYIFLPGEEQNTTIIAHEAAHIRLHHTRDIIFLNLLQVLFWPNLLIIWIKKELVQVHEFQADEATGADKEAYSELLVSSAFNRCTLPMSHSFIIHPIRRRLMMLKKGRGGFGKYIAGGLSALVTVAFFTGMITVQSCKAKQWDMKKEDKAYTGWQVDKETGAVSATLGETLKFADKMPEFPGNMMEFMIKNVNYPAEAKEKKIEGKVIVTFVVGKDGEILNPKIDKSPHEILSKEALRVIGTMPKWIPAENDGKPVAVYMTLPVSFKLS